MLHCISAQLKDTQLHDYFGAGQENQQTVQKGNFMGVDVSRKMSAVHMNDNQYFGNVPLKAWEFYIGGYQPAEKWLKDRRDRTLSMEEIQHYQKIIVALMETDRIMGEIDGVFDVKAKINQSKINA